ncbi:MAG: DeoR/GlpR transcriptional regulator, partial [Selenomonas sp.]|nr:DeoR/GlpR transcriptional regulator [Selenomonas sp.]
MLTEERYATILRILEEKKAVTVLDLTRALNASESTVRRDLTALHKNGRLYKVY